jgi:hypothetical protein
MARSAPPTEPIKVIEKGDMFAAAALLQVMPEPGADHTR